MSGLCAAPERAPSTGDIIAPSDPPLLPRQIGWQAGTCTIDLPTCSVDTPAQFFEAAAAHPPVGFTQFIVKHTTEDVGPLPARKTGRRTEGRPRRPAARPQRQPRRDAALRPRAFEGLAAACAGRRKSATAFVTAADPLLGSSPPPLTTAVYNLKPPTGEPARFGLELLGNEVFLKAGVAWDSDFHEGFTITVPKALPNCPDWKA